MCYYYFFSVTATERIRMVKKFVVIILLALLCSLLMFSSSIQQAEEKKEKESKNHPLRPHTEIVVTATATRKAVQDCSASVSIVGEVDLKATAAGNAMNCLASLPGLFVRKTGDFGRADVDIRGIGQQGRRIVVLVDGRPEKMGLFGCVVTHAFPLDNVDRIEVVRGPSSVLYGSDAMGGVVHILTHEPKTKDELFLTATYGSFNTKQMNLRYGSNLNTFKYYFTFDRRESDGHRDNSGYDGSSFTGKLSWNISDQFEAVFQGKYFSGKKFEAGSNEFPLTDFWNDYERGAVDFTTKWKGNREESILKIYRNFGHHQFSDGWHSRDYINGGIFRITSHRWPGLEMTGGIEAKEIGGTSYAFPEGTWKKSDVAIFVQNEYVMVEDLILSAGIRIHHDSLYGFELCPHLGAVYLAGEKTRLRGIINKGFRSPQLNELFMYPAANPDLKPERIWNYEAGFERTLTGWLEFSLSLFRMQGTNLVETLPHPSPPPLFLFQNAGSFTFTGAELGLNARFNNTLSGSLFVSTLNPREKTRGRPGQKWDLSLRYDNKQTFVSLQASYVTDYFADDGHMNRLPSYLLLNSRISVSLTSYLHVFVDIQNILNADYMIFLELPGLASGSYPMPGQNIHLGLSFRH